MNKLLNFCSKNNLDTSDQLLQSGQEKPKKTFFVEFANLLYLMRLK